MPSVTSNGIIIHYEEAGSGDPMLLIMGITAAGSVWADHAAAWSKDFRCIMPDNRGVGQTDTPAGPYTTAQMADDMAGLLDALELDRVRVVGLSMGGATALQLALRHAGRVRALALLCPWARCDERTEGIFRHIMHAKARFSAEEFMHFMQVLIFAGETWDDPRWREDFRQMREAAASAVYPQPVHGLEGQAHACIDHDVAADLHRIGAPALVLAGTDDAFIPPWMAEEVADGIPEGEVELYEGAGHAFHFERLEAVNERVRRWMLEH